MQIKKVLSPVRTLLTLCGLTFIGCSSAPEEQSHDIIIATPEQLYGQLFYDVQNSNISEFNDSKTFCDVVLKYPINEILKKYKEFDNKKDTTALKEFVNTYFNVPSYSSTFSDRSEINHHIQILWNFLTRMPDVRRSGTLIPLPKKYVVPGGRFREVYYWDSYFTMLGLWADNKADLIRDMIDNFAFLVDSFGFIPNGNRTYYLSRSQPPFFSLMICLLASLEKNDTVYMQYLKYLKKEYNFWMDGTDKINENNRTYRRLVRLDDGSVLNRYWDDLDIPRSEAYKEDKKNALTAKMRLGRKEKEMYRNIRAAAESGWDFSSRWFKDSTDLLTIHTVDIIPVDLNCLLYHLEMTLSKGYRLKNMRDSATYFMNKAASRKRAIMRYCWNTSKGFFMDYDFKQKKQTQVFSLAGIFPLFFKIADNSQAVSVEKKIKQSFLKDGGVVTSTIASGQQWDSPNGWAPLQWMTIQGLKNYNLFDLAEDISIRWTRLNKKVYYQTGKMLEKYNVMDTTKFGGGGEYPNQDGFGWTNGVFLGLSEK